MLLASDFDKIKYFRAADISGDLKLRIKNVTVADIGQGAEKETKADRLVHRRRPWASAQQDEHSHAERRLRRFLRRLERPSHRVVLDDGGLPRHAQSGVADSNSTTEG